MIVWQKKMSHFSEKKVKSRQKRIYLYSFMAKAFKYSWMLIYVIIWKKNPTKRRGRAQARWELWNYRVKLEGLPLTCKGKPGQWGCKQESTYPLYSVNCFVILFFLNLAICLCMTKMIWSIITTAMTAVTCPFNVALLDLQTKEFFHFHADFCHRSGVPCWIKIFVHKHCPISSFFFRRVVSGRSFLM